MKQSLKHDYSNNELYFSLWNSWYCQINTILNTKPKTMLEIGKGEGIVSNYLKQRGIEVKTLDYDERLNPDYIGDIRNTTTKEKFDLVSVCEVLEHIPYEDFEKALMNIKKMTNKYVLISLPEPQFYILFMSKFRGLKRFFGCSYLSISFGIKRVFHKNKFDGQHFWNIGEKQTPLRKVRRAIKKHFEIKKEYRNPVNPTHIFFLLEVADE